jgi:parvulin-like peptidyl-prolyl isomerase
MGASQMRRSAPQAPPPPKVLLPNDPAAPLAVVGEQPIFLGDILPRVDARIKEVSEKTGQKVPDDQLQLVRTQVARGLLVQTIQNKQMRECFLLDQVGTQPADKRKEVQDQMESRARQLFFETQVPNLLKQHEAETLSALEASLLKTGVTLQMQQRDFIDQMLASMWIRSVVDDNPKVTLAEAYQRYQQQVDEYYQPEKARWEQLTVLYKNHPNPAEAGKALGQMGREAFYGGNLSAVAREKSEEAYAGDGGIHDWISKGSLASKPLDDAIFSLPLNQLSEFITDDEGMHIIRVLERTESGYRSFAEVQEEIIAQIRKEKIQTAQKSVLKKMRRRVAVWTMFPDDVPDSRPLLR